MSLIRVGISVGLLVSPGDSVGDEATDGAGNSLGMREGARLRILDGCRLGLGEEENAKMGESLGR